MLDDGKISLPLIAPIPVRGRTIEQVQKSIAKAYVEAKILNAEQIRISVNLIRERELNQRR